MDRSQKFWDRFAARYASQPLTDERAYLKKLQLMREHIDPYQDVLEIGCGTGSTGLILAPHARRYTAVDFSGRMIDVARGKLAASGIDNLSFECADFNALDLAPASFDVVIGQSILHLLGDWRACIGRIHDLLRPGGVFISTTACVGDVMPAIRLVAPLGRWVGLLPRLSVFRLAELRAALTAAGFTIDHEWQPSVKSGVFIVAFKAPAGEES